VLEDSIECPPFRSPRLCLEYGPTAAQIQVIC